MTLPSSTSQSTSSADTEADLPPEVVADETDAIETIDVADVEPVAPDKTFADFGVQPQIVEALARAGIVHPFPIQAMTLPVALQAHDIIGQAKTGTGKTLGFGIPVLQNVIGPGEDGFDDLAEPGKPQALVVVPTRELAVQVSGDLDQASALRAARVLTVYGGRAYEPQVEALAAWRRGRRRHPRTAPGPRTAGPPRRSRTPAPWCSTRPTRCSTWASCPTSSVCSP